MNRLSVFALLPCFAATALLSACEGDIGGDPDVPGPPAVEPKAVPANPALLATTSSCAPLAAGERLLSVSPEGHAWLVTDGAESHVRVLDAFDGEIVATEKDIAIAGLGEAQAWSGADAALVSDDGLWRLADFARIELTAPDGFAAPASLCGDPGVSGALVSGGLVFERRGDSWWQWNPGTTGAAAPSRVLRHDGECRGKDDLLWLASQDGTLFRAEAQTFTRPIQFDTLRDAGTTDGLVAVLDDAGLWVGAADGSWQSWRFSGAVPEAVSASTGALWMLSGETLLRTDGADWSRVETGLDEAPSAVVAHAGGAWVVGATSICHQAVGTGLRVEGVRPYTRSTELEYAIRVRASDGSETVAADVDGAAVDMVFDPETGWLSGNARLESIGWHTLTVSSGDASRAIALKRAPEVERSWESDIQPIYKASCGGSTCHSAGVEDPPDLGSYEAWTARADKLRVRVVEGKTMPPASNVGPDWGDDDIAIISEWLEGGMLP